MNRRHLFFLIVNVAMLVGFGTVFVMRQNYEFIIYVGVIIAALALILASRSRVDYTLGTIVGLTGWAGLHLAGGSVMVNGEVLYEFMLVRLFDDFPIWRYDQLVHMWGFGSATLVMYCLLHRTLVESQPRRIALSVVLFMAGLGVGALNEVVEFVVTIIVPESGVGGYLNTSLDLCANLVGTVLGLCYIQWRYLSRTEPGAGRMSSNR